MDVEKIINLIGGHEELQKLLKVNKSAISNYKKRGRFPSYALPIINTELKLKGINSELPGFTNSEQSNPKKTIVFIVCGGISAYKAPEIIRRLKDLKYRVIPVITSGGSKFITPLTLSSVAEEKCYSEIFNLTNEAEMGHIKLSRCADAILISPASANFISKIASGICDELASTIVLASKAPIYICPAMNPAMWSNEATQNNINILKKRMYKFIGPEEGISACGEFGVGRLSEVNTIVNVIKSTFANSLSELLKDLNILITAGPTVEPIDEVRYLSNWSSGKQGYSIAEEFANCGANVNLISGPVKIDAPVNVNLHKINTAKEMLDACMTCLPVDIAIFVAAVSDWKVENYFEGKMKKINEKMSIKLLQNEDILKTVASHKKRPTLVVGFSAETENVEKNTKIKLKNKGCDWLLGNKVGHNSETFGGDYNDVILVSDKVSEKWPKMSKKEVAKKLVLKVNEYFKEIYAKN